MSGNNWQGGRTISTQGYVLIWLPDHPKADKKGYIPEHVLVCEKALEKYLPEDSMPHHVNGKKQDNRPENLVLCEDGSYHQFLHLRTRAFKACGHADWRKCWICKAWDKPENMKLHNNKNGAYHESCWKVKYTKYNQKRRNKPCRAPT